ncbi:hypothetical protein TSUD_392390 [Trifolium subterraneum]|uniref:FAR1 domain-containing protein n=1 Tax=Trifolium subterraneum TaxID=3900 RepID=A0A2Z6N136_TRISU|nr:hypothetical protein TSUD_392390 [Trifolium subterraneum]
MTIVTTPSVGMKFDNVNEAWKFWAAYGKEKGFGVRKQYSNKKKDGSIRSCRFVCCKEGHRTKNLKSLLAKNPKVETRTDCEARIALSRKDEKFVIHEFVEAHNHPLQIPETTHMLASHRKISEVQAYEIEMAEDSGLMQKASFQLMSAHVGDARMILDYEYFGDVVSLDTTYCTNGANRPLALFSGFNHHRGTVIFGSRHKLPKLRYNYSSILMQLAQIYTPTVFEVFEANDVKFVSEKYILKRWIKDARSGIIHDIHANEVVENPKLSIAQRYRQLCSIMIKFAVDVSYSESLSQLAKEGLQDLYKKVMDARLKENSTCNDQGDVPIPTTVKKRQKPTIKPSSTQQSKGIKSLSQVECTSTTTSLAHPTYSYSQTTRHLPTQQFVDIESPSQMECATSSLEHPAYVLSQATENQFSFTELLMESHVDK